MKTNLDGEWSPVTMVGWWGNLEGDRVGGGVAYPEIANEVCVACMYPQIVTSLKKEKGL